MYVCLCNCYTDKQLRDVAREGASSVSKAYRRLGRPAQCGRCISHAREVLEQALFETEPLALPAE
ncbi:MAG: (2Fe-2S)-binding protein [Rhodospirillaceae bacterium]|nr:(2Fe-2S)-binding protein [Rhodospirillaceae bacterium]